MNKAIYSIIAAVVVIGILVWGASTNWWRSSSKTTTTPNPTQQNPPSAPSQKGEASVSIKDFAFNPSMLTITKDTKVSWTNNESAPHTVVSDNGVFNSDQLGKGDTFEFTFSSSGEFTYHCGIHPSMTAKVVVQ